MTQLKFGDNAIVIQKKVGIENLKTFAEMCIGVIDTIAELLNNKLRVRLLLKSLKNIIPFLVILVKHGKTIIDEIQDLDDTEFEELENFVASKTDNKTIYDIINFLNFITILNRKKK